MSPSSQNGVPKELLAAVEEVCARTQSQAHGPWRFRLANGRALHVNARLESEWLLLEADLGAEKKITSNAERSWGLLTANRSLPGQAKFALDPDRRLRVRAEIALVKGTSSACVAGFAEQGLGVAQRLADVCAGFRAASEAARARSAAAEPTPDLTPGTSDAGDAPTPDLRDLCREAGWPFREREGERLAVELDVPGQFSQALIGHEAGGLIRASAALGIMDNPAPMCRRAGALFLLAASGVVRMARATVRGNKDLITAEFETVLAGAAGAGEIGHALAALSVACGLCSREIAALQDEETARQFLRFRGWL